MALKQVKGEDAEVVAAFDINTIANEVYEYNHGLKPTVTNVEHLPVEFYDRCLAADCWLMSPPCQPFTRGGKQRDDQDARSVGLLYLIKVLGELKRPPQWIFLENVLNFEVSECRRLLVEKLISLDYQIEEWLVSPKDLGIPNDRLRYYLCARRAESGGLREGIIRSFAEVGEVVPAQVQPISDYLFPDPDVSLQVPMHYLTEYKNYRHDITLPSSQHSTTFTKAYGSKYIIGTGSFIPTVEIREEDLRRDDPEQLVKLGLRFFSPMEIARLHGFPDGFKFPTQLPRIQQYRLLGNSMNVPVVSRLLSRLLERPE